MNKIPLRATLVLALGFVCGDVTLSIAAEEKTTEAATHPGTKVIEELPKALAELDVEPLKKVDALRTLVEEEAEANRISAPIAQSLRWSLRSTRVVAGTDLRALLTSVRVPQDNAVLTQAFRDLETTYNALQNRRGLLVRAAADALRTQTAELVRSAKTPEEVEALLRIAVAGRDAFATRAAGEFYPEQNIFTNAFVTLRALKRLMETEQASDQTALASAVATFRSAGQSDREMVQAGEISARIDRTLKQFETAVVEARGALDAAIAASKPRDELTEALGRFEAAAERWNELRSQLPATNELRALVHAYGNIVDVASAVEGGDVDHAEERVETLRASLSGVNVDERTKLEPMIRGWEKKIDAALQKRSVSQKEDARALLKSVASAEDLESVATQISKWAPAARTKRDRDANVWPALATELFALAAIWSSSNAALLDHREEADVRIGTPRMFPLELRAIRQNIERDILSKVLRLPELTAPPLAQLPIDTAIERIYREMAQRGDWRRMYEVLHARESLGARSPNMRASETLNAVRAFLAGQNFELAEQWADAVASYRTVLQTVSDLAPTQLAADRLKALVKEHPDAARKPGASDPASPRALPR